MRLMSRAALVLAALVLAAPALQAQTSFGVDLGAAVPVGDLGDQVQMGYTAAVSLGIKPPLSPIGFRAEGSYTAFNAKDVGSTSIDMTETMLALTANATLSSVTMLPMTYLIGGLGMYHVDFSGDDVPSTLEAENKFGFNIGAGLKIPLTGFGAHVEARYHYVATDPSSSFIPITFGITF